MNKLNFMLATFLPEGLRQVAPSEVVCNQQPAGTNYLVEKFPSANDMYNNTNGTVAYNSTNFPVNALPVTAGQYVRLTLTKDGYEMSQSTLVAF